MKRLLSVLFWSVIAAAFVGPGTVATAAAAGAGFGLSLLWALSFSTVACLVLQEAAARITLGSGSDLGRALRSRFQGRGSGPAVLMLILGAIVLGCAAYQAGNVLGAVAGASLATGLPRWALVLLASGPAAVLLWFARTRTIARLLGVVVGVMGLAFVVTAVRIAPAPADLLRGLFVPAVPHGAGLLVLGLVGTTVVPYNLFLGSGISHGQSIGEMRFGLAVAVGAGGLISMAVLVVGTALSGAMQFDALAATLAERLGPWARTLFATGLFTAGFTSAMTAPLAAAVTARSLFSDGGAAWNERSARYRAVWIGVMLIGLVSAFADVRPVPVILLAQALNGVILPFVAIFLLVAVNDRRVMGQALNGVGSNAMMALVVPVTVVLGLAGLMRAGATALGLRPLDERWLLALAAALAVPLAVWLVPRLRRIRGNGHGS